MKGHVVGHIVTAAVTAGIATLLHVSHEQLGAMIVVVAAIAFFTWSIGGTIWWIGRLIAGRLAGPREDDARISREDPRGVRR